MGIGVAYIKDCFPPSQHSVNSGSILKFETGGDSLMV